METPNKAHEHAAYLDLLDNPEAAEAQRLESKRRAIEDGMSTEVADSLFGK